MGLLALIIYLLFLLKFVFIFDFLQLNQFVLQLLIPLFALIFSVSVDVIIFLRVIFFLLFRIVPNLARSTIQTGR